MHNLRSIGRNTLYKTQLYLFLTGVGKFSAFIDKSRDAPTGSWYPFVALLSRINGHDPLVWLLV